jgi:hypothetical protein
MRLKLKQYGKAVEMRPAIIEYDTGRPRQVFISQKRSGV